MPLPESSSTPNPAADIEAGLLAVKQGDYATAIARLEPLHLSPNHPLHAKAQMGLAIAYSRSGRPEAAFQLCQAMSQHPNSQVQEWADRTLTSLMQRYPALGQPPLATEPSDHAMSEDVSGFVPFTSSTQVTSSPEAPHAESETGFVPLASAPATPQPRRRLRSEVGPTPPVTKSEPQGASIEAPKLDSAPIDAPPYHPTWRQAGRLPQGRSLGKVKLMQFWLAQVGTAIVLYWMLQSLVYYGTNGLQPTLARLPLLRFSYVMTSPPTWSIGMWLIVLLIASRWILDGIVTLVYGLKPLSLQQLSAYSPETVQAIGRYCRQRRIPMPKLGLIPSPAPIAFSYGVIPQVTRIVVSQGLLDQLENDEIATIYASEIGHISNWSVPLMSLAAVLAQIPYTVYSLTTEWSNRKSSRVTKFSTALITAASYGLYRLFRWASLWLSRQRLYVSDRVAVELTGNPNGLTRALLKLAVQTAQQVEADQRTPYLLEGFDLLSPIGHRAATTLGSVYPNTPLEPVLAWEKTHPLRRWLAVNNSHPPTGDRLNLLALYARHWKLDTELDLRQEGPQRKGLTGSQWRRLLLQGAPFFGFGCGLALAYLSVVVGIIGARLSIPQLVWVYGDTSLKWGLPLIGFSIGTFLRINTYFPDIRVFQSRNLAAATTLTDWLKDPDRLPIDSLPIQLAGTLIGRAGVGNNQSQDLLLQSETGMIPLHWLSRWGPIGNLLPQSVHPTALLNQPVTVTGWFRRGATVWIDVETIRSARGQVHRSDHPVWSTLLAVIAALWGVLTIAIG